MTNLLLNDLSTKQIRLFSCPLIKGSDKQKQHHPFDLQLFESERGRFRQNKAKSSLVISAVRLNKLISHSNRCGGL